MEHRILSVHDGTVDLPDGAIACHWRRSGTGSDLEPLGRAYPGTGTGLNFVLSAGRLKGALHSEPVDLEPGPALLRLDEVAFPEGAVAYRHIHPGPGIRHLVQGKLRLISDHSVESVTEGDSWFEAACSPCGPKTPPMVYPVSCGR